jgi:hypothetical protein
MKLGASAVLAAGIAGAAQVYATDGVGSHVSFHGPPAAISQGWSEVRSHTPDGVSTVTVYLDTDATEPGTADAEVTRQSLEEFQPRVLNATLKRIREVAEVYSVDGKPLNPKAVRVARIISHQLPVPVAPTVGVNRKGNIFLHFKSPRGEAYLTLEPKALHMYCTMAGRANVYIDDEPFSGQRLPKRVRDQLEELFTT